MKRLLILLLCSMIFIGCNHTVEKNTGGSGRSEPVKPDYVLDIPIGSDIEINTKLTVINNLPPNIYVPEWENRINYYGIEIKSPNYSNTYSPNYKSTDEMINIFSNTSQTINITLTNFSYFPDNLEVWFSYTDDYNDVSFISEPYYETEQNKFKINDDYESFNVSYETLYKFLFLGKELIVTFDSSSDDIYSSDYYVTVTFELKD